MSLPEERRRTSRNRYGEGGFNPTFTPLPEFLQCHDCGKLTTPLEVELRMFNPGKCAHCNGELFKRNW